MMNNKKQQETEKEMEKVFDIVINEKDQQKRIKGGWVELPKEK